MKVFYNDKQACKGKNWDIEGINVIRQDKSVFTINVMMINE